MSGTTVILVFALLFVSLVFFVPLPALGRGRWLPGRRPAGDRPPTDFGEAAAEQRPTQPERARTPGAQAADQSKRPPDPQPEHTLVVAQLRYERGDWQVCPNALDRLCDDYRATVDASCRSKLHFGVYGRDLPELRPHFVFATGHFGFDLERRDLEGLLRYLSAGGFVLVEDNNGLDYAFRAFLVRCLPTHRLEPVREAPFFEKPRPILGWPKVRTHAGDPATLFRIRIADKSPDFYYSYSADLGDGWENRHSLRIAPHKREAALRAGANLLAYARRPPTGAP